MRFFNAICKKVLHCGKAVYILNPVPSNKANGEKIGWGWTMETKDKILKWVFECENTGISSKAMAAHFSGLKLAKWGMATPSDPSDFNRCLTFLKWVPECRERLHEMKIVSKQWAALIDSWSEIESCFLDEVGLDWCNGAHLRASKTYEMMKSIGL